MLLESYRHHLGDNIEKNEFLKVEKKKFWKHDQNEIKDLILVNDIILENDTFHCTKTNNRAEIKSF